MKSTYWVKKGKYIYLGEREREREIEKKWKETLLDLWIHMYMKLANPHTSQFFEPINILCDNLGWVEILTDIWKKKRG